MQITNLKSTKFRSKLRDRYKIHKVAPIVNNYSNCPSGKRRQVEHFRCKAPKHLINYGSLNSVYTSKVLERHPFSTQTFLPLGQDLHKVSYLVIVAKTDESTEEKLPDPTLIRAFVCKGNQSVTYGIGTWHAPMVVIDEKVHI